MLCWIYIVYVLHWINTVRHIMLDILDILDKYCIHILHIYDTYDVCKEKKLFRRAPPLPPSYTDSVVRDPPFAPGFSYSNR